MALHQDSFGKIGKARCGKCADETFENAFFLFDAEFLDGSSFFDVREFAQIVRSFIDDAQTVAYGGTFQRIICLSCPCVCITMIIITIFQATGQKIRPLVLSLLRKGGLDIPLMIVLEHAIGRNGIAIATPCADTLAMLIALCAFLPFFLRIRRFTGSSRSVG